MTDNNEEEWGYVCKGHRTETRREGNEIVKEEKDKIRRDLSSKKSAETLAKIHEIKSGHDTEVKRFN